MMDSPTDSGNSGWSL